MSTQSTGKDQEGINSSKLDNFKPYIPAEAKVAEFTLKAILMGSILGIIFGAANAYLGLKVGLTVSASIPAAVVSMGILRLLMKSGTILENNMVQTIASTGEAIAAGVIFTIPALIIWGVQPSIWKIFIISLIGGFLGVLFMIPLRRSLIVNEHGKLPYPEGTACAEVLVAGDTGGSKARKVFTGAGIGALYKFLMDPHGLSMWQESPSWKIHGFKGAQIGFDILPALLGVGFIIGPRISAIMLSGGALGWLVFIPLISIIGESLSTPIFPASVPISQLEPAGIWNFYIRYIGAGAVAMGGLISLARAIPTIWESFRFGFKEITKGLKKGSGSEKIPRTQRDLPMSVVVFGSLALAVLIWIIPQIPVNFIGALLIVIFGFFFVTVSSRLVGLVGSSSNPASGMTIATLLATSLIFVSLGWTDLAGQIAALSVGAVVCIAICSAGDTSQDLKTGFLVGATPSLQQIGELIGVITSALFVGWTVYLLHGAYGIGSETLPAPQATLMSLVVKGVLTASLPWSFVFLGIVCAAIVEMFGIPSLPFAVGLYLPISLSTPIMVGGLIRGIFEKKYGKVEDFKQKIEAGILYGSGLIAGDALVGIILAILVFSQIELGWGQAGAWMGDFAKSGSLILFGILAFSLWNNLVKKVGSK